MYLAEKCIVPELALALAYCCRDLTDGFNKSPGPMPPLSFSHSKQATVLSNTVCRVLTTFLLNLGCNNACNNEEMN